MSGNIAALAGYTGSGTQGLCVVDTVKGNPEDVVSTVWTKDDNTKQLITGTNLVELESSSGKNILGGIVNFTIPASDTDIIGRMMLRYDLMLDASTQASWIDNLNNVQGDWPTNTGRDFTVDSINKIEILVGSQVWQTITSQDILSSQAVLGEYQYIDFLIGDSSNPKISIFLKLPTFTNSLNNNNNGYIMSCAPHQDFHIKVYFNNLNKLKSTAGGIQLTDATSSPQPTVVADGIVDIDNVKLLVEYTMLSNYERNILNDTTLPKRVFYTQSLTHPIKLSETAITSWPSSNDIYSKIVSPKIIINCDSFSLYCSCLLINLGQISGLDAVGGFNDITATLYLNNTRYSAPISAKHKCMIPELDVLSQSENNILINLSNTLMGYGVPFNRYDNIRIEIDIKPLSAFSGVGGQPDFLTVPLDSRTFFESFQNTTPPTNPTVEQVTREVNRYWNSRPITVTAVGYTTVLYNGGSSSITTY